MVPPSQHLHLLLGATCAALDRARVPVPVRDLFRVLELVDVLRLRALLILVVARAFTEAAVSLVATL